MSTTFTDAKGLEWEIVVSPYEYDVIKQHLDFDSYDLVFAGDRTKEEHEQQFTEAIARLETDDMFLAELLWYICAEDAKLRNVTRTDFLRSLDGTSLNEGLSAYLEALSHFFRQPAYQEFLRRLKAYLEAAAGAINKKALEEIGRTMDSDQMAKQFTDSVMHSPERSDSTPNTATSNVGDTAMQSCS